MENEIYLDNEEEGIAKETSHPNFVNHFKSDFYYSCFDDESPFGNDDGADTLYELEDLFKSGEYKNKILNFPKRLVSEIWDLDYIDVNKNKVEEIKKIIDEDKLSGRTIITTDRVIIATALGEIKIIGYLEPELKETAIKAMERQKLVFQILGYGESEIFNKIMEDFKKFENN